MKTIQEIRVNADDGRVWEIEISEKSGGGYESKLYSVEPGRIPKQIPRELNTQGNTAGEVFKTEISYIQNVFKKSNAKIEEINNICERSFISEIEEKEIISKMIPSVRIKVNGV